MEMGYSNAGRTLAPRTGQTETYRAERWDPLTPTFRFRRFGHEARRSTQRTQRRARGIGRVWGGYAEYPMRNRQHIGCWIPEIPRAKVAIPQVQGPLGRPGRREDMGQMARSVNYTESSGERDPPRHMQASSRLDGCK